MSRLRTNIITNRMANGAPTVSNGLVISGVTTTSEIFVGGNIKLDPVSGIVTATSFDGGLPITNGANNRIITASSASAIQGEANFTYDGNLVSILSSANQADGLLVHNTNNSQAHADAAVMISGGDNASAFLRLENNNQKFEIIKDANHNLVIEDDGTERLRLDSAGHVLPGADSTYNLGSNGTRFANVYADTLYGNGSNLTGISAGITMVDQWSITNDNNKNNGDVIDSHWERADYFFAQIGTGMSQSSGIFTFPQTGVYLIMSQHQMNGSASYAGIGIELSRNSGSSYGGFTYGYQNMSTVGGYHHLSLHGICDVTNVSTDRLRLVAINNASTQYSGNTERLRNGVTFIRLGDT